VSDDARRPVLARRARLRWDAPRSRHVVVVPEGVLALTEEGAEITALLDGQRSLRAVIDAVAGAHPEAPRGLVEADVREFVERLVERGYVTLETP
jgi:pyrroloquinoline quinone biosynthesis protein D